MPASSKPLGTPVPETDDHHPALYQLTSYVNSNSHSSLLRSPLPPQLRPIIQPPADLAFEAAIRRIVEGLPSQRFREIVLPRKSIRRVVIIFVTAAIAFGLHQFGRRVQNVFRRQQRTAFLCRAHRPAKRLVGGVGFRRGGQ